MKDNVKFYGKNLVGGGAWDCVVRSAGCRRSIISSDGYRAASEP